MSHRRCRPRDTASTRPNLSMAAMRSTSASGDAAAPANAFTDLGSRVPLAPLMSPPRLWRPRGRGLDRRLPIPRPRASDDRHLAVQEAYRIPVCHSRSPCARIAQGMNTRSPNRTVDVVASLRQRGRPPLGKRFRTSSSATRPAGPARAETEVNAVAEGEVLVDLPVDVGTVAVRVTTRRGWQRDESSRRCPPAPSTGPRRRACRPRGWRLQWRSSSMAPGISERSSSSWRHGQVRAAPCLSADQAVGGLAPAPATAFVGGPPRLRRGPSRSRPRTRPEERS
jgi:hypothetical protein